MTGVVNVSGGCAQSGWSAGPDMPSTAVRAVGVYFQANGKFYAMGGRSLPTQLATSSLIRLNMIRTPTAWTTKAATYP